jgi:hypothetical protein
MMKFSLRGMDAASKRSAADYAENAALRHGLLGNKMAILSQF